MHLSNRPACNSQRNTTARPGCGGTRAPRAAASAAESTVAPTKQAGGTTQQAGQRGLSFTSYEANAWKARFEKTDVTMLVDPWLVDELTFGPTSFLYRGKKSIAVDLDQVLEGVDFVLISQGLPDHAHEPTLRALPKGLPVVCSQSATALVRRCGFRDVQELDHGAEATAAGGRLRLRATRGALTGPPEPFSKRQNGFYVQEQGVEDGLLLYYEPHCDYDPASLEPQPGRVDVVITPVVNQQLGSRSVGYPLVMGNDNLEGLLRQLHPRVLIPLENAGFEQGGPLSKAIAQKCSQPDLRARLERAGLADVRAEEIEGPGQELRVTL